MRLLNTDNFKVEEFRDDKVLRYAILLHTWDKEEGTRAANKKGYKKVKSCYSVARANGLKYIWIDICYINKISSAELSKVINSIYYYYLANILLKAIFLDISNCTSIPVSILLGDDNLKTAAKRKISRIKDRAYYLLGIFSINIPLIYGERETAFTRL
ncbi:hypothetical protein V2W45_1518389 [Cenococcum geophilum]